MSEFDLEEFLKNPLEGWETFWTLYGSCVKRAICKFNLTREDTEDILQEATVRLIKDDFEALRKWDKHRSSLCAYLHVIARSVSLDYLKSSFHQYNQKKIKTKEEPDREISCLDFLMDPNLTPDEFLQKKEVIRGVWKCLHEWSDLKDEDRDLLYLRFMGVPFRKISKIKNIKENALMTRFSRLREELRRRLEDGGIDLSEI